MRATYDAVAGSSRPIQTCNVCLVAPHTQYQDSQINTEIHCFSYKHTHTPNTWTEHVYWLCVFMLLWYLWPWTTKPVISSTGIQVHLNKLECCGKVSAIYFSNSTQLKQKEPLPSIEYIYSKLTYFPKGQQFTKNVFFIGLMNYSNLLRQWNGGVLLNVSQNHHN